MVFKIVLLVALLMLATAMPEPDPEPNVKIGLDININNKDGGSGNDLRKRSCFFNGTVYPDGSPILKQCMRLKCNDGCWEFTGIIGNYCGNCTFGGEPWVYTFDPLENKNYTDPLTPNPLITNYRSNSLGGWSGITGDYSMVQPGFSNPAPYGVKGHFNNTGPCAGPLPWKHCFTGITYYEPGIEITLHIPPTHCSSSAPSGSSCKIEVYVNGKIVQIPDNGPCPVDYFSAIKGPILMFRHKDLMSRPNVNCISIIGTKGLTAALCHHPSGGLWYNDPWAYVLAPLTVSRRPSLLYGLCNTLTSHDVECYYGRNATGTKGTCYKAAKCFPPDGFSGPNIQCSGFPDSWEV